MKIGDGRDTDFWRDPWCGRVNLKKKFRELYEINNEQHTSVADMAQGEWILTFRRWLDKNAQSQLRQLGDILMSYALGQQKDKPIWVRERHKSFSVKSMYAHMCEGGLGNPTRESHSPKNQGFHVAGKPKCYYNKRQYAEEKMARRPTLQIF
jgi:hypothetical protein